MSDVQDPLARWVDVVDGIAWAHEGGRTWRIGTGEDVAWIRSGTTTTNAITSSTPARYDAYATIVQPPTGTEQWPRIHAHLAAVTTAQPWFVGYLDTGGEDLVFPDAPRVLLHACWPYVLVEADAAAALRWKPRTFGSWRSPGPDLVFPADRSWLLTWLWDDTWRCLGGPRALVDAVLADQDLDVREVSLDDVDVAPPGHVSR